MYLQLINYLFIYSQQINKTTSFYTWSIMCAVKLTPRSNDWGLWDIYYLRSLYSGSITQPHEVALAKDQWKRGILLKQSMEMCSFYNQNEGLPIYILDASSILIFQYLCKLTNRNMWIFLKITNIILLNFIFQIMVFLISSLILLRIKPMSFD